MKFCFLYNYFSYKELECTTQIGCRNSSNFTEIFETIRHEKMQCTGTFNQKQHLPRSFFNALIQSFCYAFVSEYVRKV